MTSMSEQDRWITEHFEVGIIGTNTQALACRYCGAFVWDTEKHMSALHQTEIGNVHRNLPRFRPAAPSEGVGTGAGEGAPRQDTGSAWVTRSADCPEAPAQAHPLATGAEGSWVCGRCGQAPEAHAPRGVADTCVYDPCFRPAEAGGE